MSKEIKHTPPPWLLNAEYSPACVRDKDGLPIADCSGTGRDKGEEVANAHLVIAVTDLLAVAERIVAGGMAFPKYERELAKAAIAKAKGEPA